MLCLVISYLRVPHPEILEAATKKIQTPDTLSKVFWLYSLFTFIATAGFCSFILIAFHFKLQGVIADSRIPLLYAMAMGIDALAALSVGKMYDVLKSKHKNQSAGLNLLVIMPIISLLIPLLVFTNNIHYIVVGICLWGVVMGMHETIMRSAIADITSLEKRGTGYGFFNATYGFAVLVGSSLLGFLYSRSIYFLAAAVIILESAAFVVFFFMKREIAKEII